MNDPHPPIQSVLTRLNRIQDSLKIVSEREARQLASAGVTTDPDGDDIAEAMREGLLFDALEAGVRELSCCRSQDHNEALQKLQVWLSLSDIDVEQPDSVLDELIISVTQDLLILLSRSEAA